MFRKALVLITLAFSSGLLTAAGFVGYGWWTYKRQEKAIVEKMDQYYLTITSQGREEYLLESDETFEVPYLASKFAVAAVPTRFFDVNDRLLGEFSTDKSIYVGAVADIPEFLKRALVAAEDGTFYRHRGVNWRAIARALLTDMRHMRRVQGGSTLTQQLAKMMFTTRKKTINRKVFELFCARKIETKFTKDQILLMYLNFAYFGHGCFGVESAARYYFGKPARELELAQAAMLVGLVASPNKYSPYENLELSRARHRTVLARMAKLGFIPASAVDRYSSQFWREMAESARKPEVSFWRMSVNEAPYAVEHLRRALLQDFSKERLLKGGLKIHTTFDLDVQKAAQQAMAAGLRELNGPNAAVMRGSPIEGALAAVRPQDGALLALVGGSGFDFQNQLIRASDSRRPMGSAIKPFIFAAAFESGKFKPDDLIEDSPIRFSLPGGRRWAPHNYGNKYFGRVTLRAALRKSLNSVAIRVLQGIDIDGAIALLAAATGEPAAAFPRNMALALGAADVSAVGMARAYAVLANGGKAVEPYSILYIEDRDGKILRDERARPAAAEILAPDACALMVDILKGVLGPDGTAYSAALKTGFNIPAIGKTGTTNEYRDAWFAGATPDMAAAVWLGRDDMRVPLGRGQVGGAIAAPIWMNFVKGAYRGRPTRDFSAFDGDRP